MDMTRPFNFNVILGWTSLLIVSILLTIVITRKPQKENIIHSHMELCTRFPMIDVYEGQEQFQINVKYKLMWQSTKTLYVYFFGASDRILHSRIIQVANEWSRYCGIKFKDTISMRASHIRIAFDKGGYGSAVGIEAIQHNYKDRATMCLQGLDTLKDKNEFYRVVLHEFGHALGLEHELRHPHANIPWDTAAVYKYYLDHRKWQPATVDRQIFAPLDSVWYSDFDSTSIMIYAVPDTLTKGSYKVDWPKGLSRSDRQYIRQWYEKI